MTYLQRLVKEFSGQMKKTTRKIQKFLRISPLYQAKRATGTEQRWELIRTNLSSSDKSLLDVGCNLGLLTRKAADAGLGAIGVDGMRKAVLRARRLHRDVPRLATMLLDITPDSVEQLPRCDVVLCLSIHHYWVANHGQETAWVMIRKLIEKSQSKFFFEPASRQKKYGTDAPDFVDLDEDSLRAHHLERLRDVAGPHRTVECLGATKCMEPEPFRLMFIVSAK